MLVYQFRKERNCFYHWQIIQDVFSWTKETITGTLEDLLNLSCHMQVCLKLWHARNVWRSSQKSGEIPSSDSTGKHLLTIFKWLKIPLKQVQPLEGSWLHYQRRDHSNKFQRVTWKIECLSSFRRSTEILTGKIEELYWELCVCCVVWQHFVFVVAVT